MWQTKWFSFKLMILMSSSCCIITRYISPGTSVFLDMGHSCRNTCKCIDMTSYAIALGLHVYVICVLILLLIYNKMNVDNHRIHTICCMNHIYEIHRLNIHQISHYYHIYMYHFERNNSLYCKLKSTNPVVCPNSMWKSVHIAHIEQWNPCTHGWKPNDKRGLVPDWYKGERVLTSKMYSLHPVNWR